MGASSFQVLVDEPVLIVPDAPPEPSSTLFLNNFDQHVFFTTDLSFFFEGPPQVDAETDLIEVFRESLAKVLVPYRFLAGRYRLNDEQGRLEINNNAAGVLFAGAVSDVTMDELGDLSVPNPDFKKFFMYPSRVCCIEDIPLLTVQVTKFPCGGVAICFVASHVALDGGSLCKFVKDYAGMVCNGSEVVVKVNPDRTFLKARSPLRVSFPHKELSAAPDIPARLFFNPAHYDRESPATPPGFASKTFRFTPDILKSLKAKVVLESGGAVQFCSAFEVLSALVWQARTKALKMELQEPSKLFLVIDFRKQLEDSLPANFVGNAIICVPCIDFSAQVVCGSSLAFCVEKIQETKRSVTAEYVRSVVDWCESNHGITNLPGGVLVTTWSKLGYDEVNFGFGQPKYVAPLVNARHDFVTLVSNCKGDGGVDVCIGMQQQEHMEEFQRNLTSNLLV